MKKIVVSLLLMVLSVPVFAQHYARHGHHGHHGYWRHAGGPNPWVWAVPTIIGGVVGYEIARQQSVIVQQPVVVQTTPVPMQQNCSPWTETQNPDGAITRTRTCSQ